MPDIFSGMDRNGPNVNGLQSHLGCVQKLVQKTFGLFQFPQNQALEVVKHHEHHPFLRVEVTDSVKFNQHIDCIRSKASRVLRFVKLVTSNIALNCQRKSTPDIVEPVRPNLNTGLLHGTLNNYLRLSKLDKFREMRGARLF